MVSIAQKIVTLVLAALGLSFALAGCGQKEEAPVTEPTPIPVVEEKAPPKVEEKAPPKEETAKSLKNALTAFNGESNAIKRYEAFAAKADEEGYKDAANLFRSASKAESIHAAALAELITKMGGTATPTLAEPEIKTTEENLKAALAGETEELTNMYPGFIETAKAEENADALRIFNGAKAAEESHAKFYNEASENLKAWKKDTRTFFVCGICGYTVTKVDFESCPICTAPKDKYTEVK